MYATFAVELLYPETEVALAYGMGKISSRGAEEGLKYLTEDNVSFA
jgi:hypothetical protein